MSLGGLDVVWFCKPVLSASCRIFSARIVFMSHSEKRLTLINGAYVWLSHLESALFKESFVKSVL